MSHQEHPRYGTYGTAAQRLAWRQEEADARKAAHDALTPEEKIAKAFARGGPTCKEYLRLSAEPS